MDAEFGRVVWVRLPGEKQINEARFVTFLKVWYARYWGGPSMIQSINLSSFYARMGFLMLAIVLAGFLPFVHARFDGGGKMEPMMAAHGISYLMWFALFISQASLIAGRNVKLHITLGKTSLLLAIVMGVTAIMLTGQSYALQSNGGTPFPPKQFIMLPIMDISLFLGFYTLAMLKRGKALTHKHLMLFVGIMMLDPATGRLGLTIGIPPLALLMHFSVVALVWWHDRKAYGGVHTVTKWATAVLVLRYLLFFTVGSTEAWAGFVTALFGG
jgi:hypothetical protein